MRDLTGQTFGRLTAFRYLRRGRAYSYIWLCHCSCGKSCERHASSLVYKLSESCGCEKIERCAVTRQQNRSKPLALES